VIPTWIAGPLAMLAIYWCLSRANRPSDDGIHFRQAPLLRVLYPAVFTGFLVMIPFGVGEVISAHSTLRWNEWLAFAALPALCLTLAITWPPTITVGDTGLRWRKLVVRRLILWSDIEAANVSTDGRLVIDCRGGKQYEVSQFIVGRQETAVIVNQRLAAAERVNRREIASHQ
jgi:hypothetical protein